MSRERRIRPSFRDDDITQPCAAATRQMDVTQIELGIRERLIQSLARSTSHTTHSGDFNILPYMMITLLNRRICRAQRNKRYMEAIRYQYCVYLLEDGAKSSLQILHDLWLKPSLARLI